MKATCIQCGTPFNTFPSYVKRRPSGGYCSQQCRSVAHRYQPTCAMCGTLFPPLKLSQHRIYCSSACREAASVVRAAVRLEQLTRKTETCWLWTGSTLPTGYGLMGLVAGRPFTAHRFAWFVAHGEIPRGQQVMHACDTPACVNPAHLSLGTAKDNIHDSIQKGRFRAWLTTGKRLNGEAVKGRPTMQTHCCRGHELTGANLRICPSGRSCRACGAIRARAYYLRQKAS